MNCSFPSVKFNSREDYLFYTKYHGDVESEHKKIECELCKDRGTFFDVEGYCSVCEAKRTLRVDFEHSYEEDGIIVPNFRERLFCTTCGSISRIRCMVQKIRDSIEHESKIYITEQVTPIYSWLLSRYPHVIGSEYLDSQCPHGESLNGIRNEDLTHLSFENESFTHILSFDVLEHVSSLNKSLKEVFRCLKPGGKFIFTVPFSINSIEHDVYAIVENGVVVHKKDPVFHGNPLSANGSLVFTVPGWKLFEDLKEIGFAKVSVEKVWSLEYGYLGSILIFTAVKDGYMAGQDKSEKREICTVPFTTIQVHMGGDVFLCCPAWTNYYTIGNIFKQSFEDIWNGDRATFFREKMLKGDYSLCNNRVFCRHFSGNFVTDENFGEFDFSKPVLKYIAFAHDNECNLACKMCRNRFVKNSREIVETLDASIERVLLPMVDNVEIVHLSGNGDIFFSRHYRKLAKAISLHNVNVSFSILTNGMGLTEKNCTELGILGRISSVSVSIDAASESIYRKIRRGGKLSTLKRNLEWFCTQKYNGREIPKSFNFCVQRTNYTDIPDFIEFSKHYNAIPSFTYFRDEKTVDFDRNNILSENHPDFERFLSVIHSDKVKDSQHYFDAIYAYIGDKYRINLNCKPRLIKNGHQDAICLEETTSMCERSCTSVNVEEHKLNDLMTNKKELDQCYSADFNEIQAFAVRQCNISVSLLGRLTRIFMPLCFWQQRMLAGGAVDASWYLAQYPDVAAGNMNPALHYIRYGWKEGRNPNSWFDTKKYLANYSDVVECGMNPLLHYCLHGVHEGRKL